MTEQDKTEKNVALFCKEGSSDKEYRLWLKKGDSGWIVEYANGKRGKTLTHGLKTKVAVDYETALAAYLKVVKEKTKDGYTTEESGVAFQSTNFEERVSGIVPQLSNLIKEGDVEICMKSSDWMAQEKYDGERRMLSFKEEDIMGVNRKGLIVPLRQDWVEEVKKIGVKSITLDGEDMGSKFVIFDILELNGKSLVEEEMKSRAKILKEVLKLVDSSVLEVIKTAETYEEKMLLHDKVRAECGEGLVFKKADSKYVAGRPASGGSSLKLKFIESATVFVQKSHATKRSVYMSVLQGDEQVDIGKVSVPSNYAIPKDNEVIEVQYLYAYKGGSLFQPVYRGVRGDQDISDCKIEQLKYKKEEPDATQKISI